jgi:type III pantothenate kinase
VKLLLDLGNSRLKWALWDGRELHGAAHCPLKTDPGGAVRTLLGALPGRVEGAVIANVAGAWVADALRRGLARHCEETARFVATTAQACGVRCAYAEPARLGVDRWVATIAAFHRACGAALVIDAGTAVTVDVVDDAGQHLGGLILASPELMARALYRDTSDIGHARVQSLPGEGAHAFGRSTDDGVSFGAILALAGAVDRALAEATAALGQRPALFVTGGGAPVLLPYLPPGVLHRPLLMLEGLAVIADDERSG